MLGGGWAMASVSGAAPVCRALCQSLGGGERDPETHPRSNETADSGPQSPQARPSFFTDLCHPGLGPQQTPAVLPGDEHRHVGAPHHRAAGGPAQGLRLHRDPLCGQEAGLWRPRWVSGQAHSSFLQPHIPARCDLQLSSLTWEMEVVIPPSWSC